MRAQEYQKQEHHQRLRKEQWLEEMIICHHKLPRKIEKEEYQEEHMVKPKILPV